MIRINLLPQGHIVPSRPVARGNGLLWAGAVVAALVGVGAYYTWQYGHLRDLERQLAGEQTRLSHAESEMQRADRVIAGEQSAAQQEEHLRRLKGRAWSPLFLELRDLTPQGVTWLHLGVDGDTVTINGRAERMSDLAHFMAALNGSLGVRQVDLHSARAALIGGKSEVQELDYELAVHLAPVQGGTGNGA